MAADYAKELAEADRAFLTAPAGCGKTYTIAKSVARSSGRQLVLTHTHAGVAALRKKMDQMSVAPQSVVVETIAGWALRYVAAYPSMAQFKGATGHALRYWIPDGDEQYATVYEGCAQLLGNSSIRDVVRATYAGVYVDEYQDCTAPMEQLILALASIVPCRIVGDPMQGIFGFAGELADMAQLPSKGFRNIGELSSPERWLRHGDEKLGAWLLKARDCLRQDKDLYIDCTPAKFVPSGDMRTRVSAAYSLINNNGETGVIILDQHNQCRELAGKLRGLAQVVEPIYSPNLLSWCERISGSSGEKRALLLLDFAKECVTKVATEFKTLRGYLESAPSRMYSRKHPQLGEALQMVAESDDLALVLRALEVIDRIATDIGANVYCKELLRGLKQALCAHARGDYQTLKEAACNTRRVLSRTGRRLPRVVVSRTVLVKGLEFDHALVFTKGLKMHDLYVAITRASKSLTIVSDSPVIIPAPDSTQRRKKSGATSSSDHPTLAFDFQ